MTADLEREARQAEAEIAEIRVAYRAAAAKRAALLAQLYPSRATGFDEGTVPWSVEVYDAADQWVDTLNVVMPATGATLENALSEALRAVREDP